MDSNTGPNIKREAPDFEEDNMPRNVNDLFSSEYDVCLENVGKPSAGNPFLCDFEENLGAFATPDPASFPGGQPHLAPDTSDQTFFETGFPDHLEAENGQAQGAPEKRLPDVVQVWLHNVPTTTGSADEGDMDMDNATPIKRPLSPYEEMTPRGTLTVPEPGRRWKKNKVYNPVETDQQRLLEAATSVDLISSSLSFNSMAECRSVLEQSEDLFKKPLSDSTTPASDSTFPETDHEMKDLVFKIYTAIMDWASYIEWMQIVPKPIKEFRSAELVEKIEQHETLRKQGRQVTENALQIRDLIPPESIRQEHMTDVKTQQREVLGRVCNALSAECIAWKLVQAAMESQQGRAGSMPWTTNDGA